MPGAVTVFAQNYFHGTKADLKLGDLFVPQQPSNFGKRQKATYVFLTATLDAAIWGAELALGAGKERIYLVEPTGAIENDPDLTDRKFPGNPTQSFRSAAPMRIVGEVSSWQSHDAHLVQSMKEQLARLHEQGVQSLNE